MNSLKTLCCAIALTILLAGTALADELNSPPCPSPGEINSPPCTSNQLVGDDSTEQTATTSEAVETIVIMTAMSAVEDLLTIY